MKSQSNRPDISEMPPYRLGRHWNTIQAYLIPGLEDDIGELSGELKQFMGICELLIDDKMFAKYRWCGNGRPPSSRVSLFKAYILEAREKGVTRRRDALSDINVTDVVEHLGVSRRLADRRFREIEKSSIMETIISIRLNEVKSRLASTRLPIGLITQACGFKNDNYAKNLFRRRFGMSMREWRKHVIHERE